MPLDDYEKMCAPNNLGLAYRWIQSNPDAFYKSHFRDAYTAYAASSQHNLRRLRKNLLRRAYEPGHATKIYLPKPSGILRPYTLLSVDDQIVYQACVNIIAEKLTPFNRKRYLKTVFGHLYAGKKSKFFYIKWQEGYRAFSKSVIKCIAQDYKHVANFDLTSFYDSIDHHVLRHFLLEIKIDNDLIDFLLKCLKTWTCNPWTNVSNYIYHEHGIPQGPLSSGLLSEVVLRHLDSRGERLGKVKYLRYVDDIKIFAKSESPLRQRLVSLDLASKEIGLFPQSSKINIREVKDPNKEIKSISRPPEPALKLVVNQAKLIKRILELIKGGKVKDGQETRFKYLIANTEPTCKLNDRLILILLRQPAFSQQVSFYFSKYNKLPKKAANTLLDFLCGDEIYQSVHGDILFAVLDNMQESDRTRCIAFCHNRLLNPKRNLPKLQPTYKAALIAWVLKYNRITYGEFEALVKNNDIDWWAIKDILKHLEPHQYGSASYEKLLNDLMKSHNTDVARVAALKVVDDDLELTPPTKELNEAAKLLLYAGGKLRHIGKPESLVGTVLCYVLNRKFSSYNWERLLNTKHIQAEHIAFTVKRNYESNIDACIVTLDSLCDLIFEALFTKYVPGKSYGKYGSMLQYPTLKSLIPNTCAGFDKLHQLRLQSVTAHPRNLKTGGNTRRLKHHDFSNVKKVLCEAVQEIINVVTV